MFNRYSLSQLVYSPVDIFDVLFGEFFQPHTTKTQFNEELHPWVEHECISSSQTDGRQQEPHWLWTSSGFGKRPKSRWEVKFPAGSSTKCSPRSLQCYFLWLRIFKHTFFYVYLIDIWTVSQVLLSRRFNFSRLISAFCSDGWWVNAHLLQILSPPTANGSFFLLLCVQVILLSLVRRRKVQAGVPGDTQPIQGEARSSSTDLQPGAGCCRSEVGGSPAVHWPAAAQ